MVELDEKPRTVGIRAIWEGATYGLLAGVVFLAIQIVIAVRSGGTPLLPMRWFASVLIGTHAFAASPAAVFLIGMAVHLGLSAGWGVVFCAIAAREPAALRESGIAQLALGALFGLVVWFVDFALIARLFYGWLLGLPIAAEIAIHVVFFGAPLGFLYGMSEQALGAPEASLD